jgi:hypothetical protein
VDSYIVLSLRSASEKSGTVLRKTGSKKGGVGVETEEVMAVKVKKEIWWKMKENLARK